MTLRICLCRAAILACAALPASASFAAEAYPSRPVRLIVPFPPGGGNDIVARLVAGRLAEGLGQQVVVDNRGGAGGTLGTDMTAKARPDGHTLLINNLSLAVNHTLFPRLPYDTLKELAPVSLIGRQPNIVAVHPALPARTVRELLELARARPGALNFGQALAMSTILMGVTAAGFLAIERFRYGEIGEF